MISTIQLIAGVSIFLALGFIILFIKDYMTDSKIVKLEVEDEAFCDINLDYLMMNNQNPFNQNGNDVSRRIQGFKNRNRFYKM